MKIRDALVLGVALAALSTPAIAQTEAAKAEAAAKPDAAEDTLGLNEIVVTASARPANRLDSSVSVSALSGQAVLDAARARLEGTASDYQRAKEAAKRAEAAEAARKLREQEESARLKAAESTGTAAARAEGKADNLASAADRHEAAAEARTADLVRTSIGGVTASAKSVWTFRVRDYEALAATMGPLGPYLAQADVEKAIRSLVKLRKGGTSLPGVEVFEDTKATFR